MRKRRRRTGLTARKSAKKFQDLERLVRELVEARTYHALKRQGAAGQSLMPPFPNYPDSYQLLPMSMSSAPALKGTLSTRTSSYNRSSSHDSAASAT